MGLKRWLVHTPPSLGLALTGIVGILMRDIVLTRDEVDGLMSDLLLSSIPLTGTTKFGDWLMANADDLGRHYESELQRNFRTTRHKS